MPLNNDHDDNELPYDLSTSSTGLPSSSSSSKSAIIPPKRISSPYLSIPSRSKPHRRSSLDSTFSGSDLSELSFAATDPLFRHDDDLPRLRRHHHHDPSQTPSSLKARFSHTLSNFYITNYGALLVVLSQFFGSLMNLCTTLLEHSTSQHGGMHPFQILFVRQSITSILCISWASYTRAIPHFPFGPPSVKIRLLLVTRGMSGFFGVFGMYYSLLYLPLAEATVLTFLAPILTCYLCSFVLPGESSGFGRQQQIAAFVSLVGVVFIAQPAALFTSSSNAGGADGSTNSTLTDTSTGGYDAPPMPSATYHPTPSQHLHAILISLVGVLGATGAMTSIRAIGTRAHPFLSINYFSVWCSIVSLAGLIFVPSVSFRLPADLREWGLLAALGAFGFTMQWLLTAGLSYGNDGGGGGGGGGGSSSHQSDDHDIEHATNLTGMVGDEAEEKARMVREQKMKQGSGTRATSMVYTQMLFALAGDKIFFGTSPTWYSWVGSGFILAGAIWVAAAKDGAGKKGKKGEEEQRAIELESGSGGWMRKFRKFKGETGGNGNGNRKGGGEGREESVGLMSGANEELEDDEEDGEDSSSRERKDIQREREHVKQPGQVLKDDETGSEDTLDRRQ